MTAPNPPATPTTAELLRFEAAHPRNSPAKWEAVRSTFGWMPTRYVQALHRAVDSQEGQQFDAITCRRVRKIRDELTDRRARETAARSPWRPWQGQR